MPDRAIPPLLVSVIAGLAGGLIVAMLQLDRTQTIVLGLGAAVAVVLTSLPTTLRQRAPATEKLTVSLLRTALALAVFVFTYAALITFLNEGSVLALLFAAIALVNGFALSQLEVRERKAPEEAARN
ncbi:MAG: hypothetical protein M3370_01010 [Actinomycetota bacterium]|nr:hypothetical protein [Actinomycetota bacterium]